MGISEMTYVSYFFIILAVVFGGAAVILFFALDIRRCWRIARGRYAGVLSETVPSCAFSGVEQSVHSDKTEKLAYKETEVLVTPDHTTVSETMTLMRDIVMTDASNW